MLVILIVIAVKSLVVVMTGAAAICILTAVEVIRPREELLSWRDRGRLLAFVAMFTVTYYVTQALMRPIMATLEITPLIPNFGWIDAITAILVADFCYYWFHRAMHSNRWLWRVHAVHHSAERLGAGAGFQHPLEAPLKAVMLSVPAALIFQGGWTVFAGLFVAVHGYYCHSTTSVNLGRFAWVVCDNRVHRIHHSREPRHFDKNFGIVTLLWDRLFGTSYFPKAGEWPAVGLEGEPEPKSAKAFLLQPFTAARKG